MGGLRCAMVGAVLAILAGCGGDEPLEAFGGPTMGSTYSIKYVRTPGTPAANDVQPQVERILAEVDRQLSTYRSDSDIERFNDLPANRCQPMPESILQLVRTGEQLSQASGGAFDLTVEPLLNLWGFGPQARQVKVPDPMTLALARQRVGHQADGAGPEHRGGRLVVELGPAPPRLAPLRSRSMARATTPRGPAPRPSRGRPTTPASPAG